MNRRGFDGADVRPDLNWNKVRSRRWDMLGADRGGPTMSARIGVMRALNRHVERVFDPSRKEKLGQAQTRARSMKQEAVKVAA